MAAPRQSTPEPDRCLQVGFVSVDLRNHAVASFIEPVLAHLGAHASLSLHAYANHVSEDKVSQRLRAYVKHWHRVASLSDAALAEKIRADGIDILIDLSGHTAHNRLLSFARKAAPVQISWMGYPGSTGLSAMDYYLSDRFLLPPGIVVAGGMESMSNVPFYAESMRWGNKYGNTMLIDGLAKDGLTDVYDGKAMGTAAELCATDCKVSREDQDAFSVESYKRSQAAVNDGKFKDEIVPVEIPQRKGDAIVFDKDEEPFNVKFDKIAGLKGAFVKDGTVTAANSSTMNDGAAAVVLMSKEKMEELGLKPLAKIVSYADAEQAPEWFTTTPSLAVPRAVQKAGLNMEDISYWELNEAFAVVGIENSRRMKLDPSKVNVNGGAVSIGHPLGCSGARIIVTLINVLKQNKAKYGAAGICNGGGGASAIVIENIEA